MGKQPADGSQLGLRPDHSVLGVSCEACHGPRADHVRLMRSPNPTVSRQKLTADQKSKLEAIQKDTSDKLQGAPQDQRRTINQDARQKAGEVLTADQKAAIEKYNKEHPRQGRRQQP